MARAISITERAAGGVSWRDEGLGKGGKGAAGRLHQRPASTVAGPVLQWQNMWGKKKLPEEPQARPGLRPGYTAKVRGLLDSFSLVLEKLLENQHPSPHHHRHEAHPNKDEWKEKLEEEWLRQPAPWPSQPPSRGVSVIRPCQVTMT